jgi:hypothetical protein
MRYKKEKSKKNTGKEWKYKKEKSKKNTGK